MKYTREVLSIRETPLDRRPRERLQAIGPEGLSDHELLAIIIGSGSRSAGVHEIAGSILHLLDKHGSDTTIDQIASIKGVGKAKSSVISAALELGRRHVHGKKQRITYPSEVYPLIRHYADRPQEHFLSISLNGAHEVMGIRIVSIGLVNRTVVHPREVFAQPLQDRATAIIVAHNHPSGNLSPSSEDMSVTKRLTEAGLILGIELLDHIIFSEQGYFSFLEQGMMPS